jgi:hypothetical protein
LLKKQSRLFIYADFLKGRVSAPAFSFMALFNLRGSW